MTWRRAALVSILLLGACADFPRDTDGTLERSAAGDLRAGVVADPRAGPEERRLTRALLAAMPDGRPVEGAGEPLLLALERGDLDIVVGRFDKRTPWATRVTFTKPMLTRGELELKAATRNGEHAWAMRVERAAAALSR